MIGHDDKTMDPITLAVIEKQAVDDYLSDSTILQQATAIVVVEPFVYLISDNVIVFLFRLLAPRLRMSGQPLALEFREFGQSCLR